MEEPRPVRLTEEKKGDSGIASGEREGNMRV